MDARDLPNWILRLDANADDDALEARIRLMVAGGEMEPVLGKELMNLHRNTKGEIR